MTLRKRKHGKNGHSYEIDGEKVDGVTTSIKNGRPNGALINWAANVTADFAVDHWHELSENTISERSKRLRSARFAQRDEAAKRGTEVHKIAESLIYGHEVDVPDEIAGHVESYVRFLDEWQPKPLLVETPVGSRQWSYAGTLDAVVDLRDGRRVIVDIKTARSGIFADAAYQLAAYAGAEFYLDGNGDEQSMSELGISAGFGIWVRADGYDVHPLDISEQTFKTFLHLAHVARKTADDRSLVGEATRPVEVAA